MEYFGLMVLSVIFGLWLGTEVEATRWRDNADMIQNIESKGRLYKVTQQ
jgi:hypothetical protein